MEDIRYRAQRHSDRKWVYGFYVRLDDGNCTSHRIYSGYVETDGDYFFDEWDEIDPDTLGVLLGEDGNGNDVYSGDILRSDMYPFTCDEEDDYYAIACFNDMHGYLYCIKNRLKENNPVRGMSEGDTYEVEDLDKFYVIGTEFDDNLKGLFPSRDENNNE